MSELKIKVGLELDDDIKELIHKEIIRQLQEYSNCSVVTNGDNFTWSTIHKDDEISELRQDINELKCEFNAIVK